MRKLLLFFAALASVASLPTLNAQAQDTLTPIWSRATANTPMSFSKNGAVMMSGDNNGVRAWNTSTGQLICAVAIQSYSRVLANDGSGFYYSYSDRSRLFFYNFATRAITAVKTDGTQYGGSYNLAISADGTKICYSTYNSTSSRVNITTASLSTGGTLNRWSLAASQDAYQIAWVNGDARIAVLAAGAASSNGLKLYTNTGTIVATKTSAPYAFQVDPDSNTIYTRDSTGALAAYDATSTLTTVWSAAGSSIAYDFKVSSDGNVLISSGLSPDSAYYAMRCYSTADGSQLSGTMNVSTSYGIGEYAASPTTNAFVYYNHDGGAHLGVWTFDSSTGNGTQGSNLNTGQTGYVTPQTFGSVAAPRMATQDPTYGGFRIFNSNTGVQTLFNATSNNSGFSGTGTYYVWVGYRPSDSAYGAHVSRTSDDAIIDSYLSNNVQAAGWNASGDNRIWIYTSNDGGVRVLSFNGTALSPVANWVPNIGADVKVLNSGSRLFIKNINTFEAYNASTGASVGSIDASDLTGTNILSWGLSGTQLWAYDWKNNGDSTYTQRLRLYDAANSLSLVKTITGDTVTNFYDYGVVDVSDDATVAVISRTTGQAANGSLGTSTKVYRIADSAVLKSYTDQMGDWATTGVKIAKDNAAFAFFGSYVRALVGVELQAILSSVSVNPTSVVGGNSTTGTVTINRPAPTGGIVVSLSADSGLSVPASVTITAGNTSANFTVGTDGVDASTNKTITATYGGLPQQVQVTVTPATTLSISFNPNSVDGGSSSTGTITLNGKAGPSGYVVNLSSNQSYVTVPGSATVTSGNTSVTFTANTTDPGTTGTATVTGTHGDVTGNGTLQVKTAGATVTFVEASVKGGNALTLKITLAQPAPAGGKSFNLVGDALSVPPSVVTIPAGATTADFGVHTNATLTDTNTTVSATPTTGGSTVNATALVKAPIIKSLESAALTTTGNRTLKLLVLLDGIAPTGLSYSVSSSSGNIVVPANVTITAGANFAVIDMTVKKSPTTKNVKVTVGTKIVTIKVLPFP